MSSDAAHRWARRRTDRPPGEGSPTRAGNPDTRRYGPRPRQPRSPPTPEGRRHTLPRSARSGSDSHSGSLAYDGITAKTGRPRDRKSVGEGRSVAVGVDIGGGRITRKKKQKRAKMQ